MAISNFSKKLMRNMSVDQKAALAASTTDLDLLFKLMNDKSQTVSEKARNNPLRFSLAGVQGELPSWLATGTALRYIDDFEERLSAESAHFVFEQLAVLTQFRAIATAICSKYNFRFSPIRSLLLGHFVADSFGKEAAWFVRHPFIKGLASEITVTNLHSTIEKISGSREVANRATYLLFAKEEFGDQLQLVYLLPDLFKKDLEENRSDFLRRLSRRADSHSIPSKTPDETVEMLMEALRDEGDFTYMVSFASEPSLNFTYEELVKALVSSSRYGNSRPVERLVKDFGKSRQDELKAVFLGKYCGHEAESYLNKLIESEHTSVEEEVVAFKLYGILPTPSGLAKMFAKDLVDGRVLHAIKELAQKGGRWSGGLTEEHYQTLWNCGQRSITLYLCNGAEAVAVQHFSSDDLWEALRNNNISRLGKTSKLRSLLNDAKAPKKPVDRLDLAEGDEHALDEEDNELQAQDMEGGGFAVEAEAAAADTEEDDEKDEREAQKVEDYIKKTPLGEILPLYAQMCANVKHFKDKFDDFAEELDVSTLDESTATDLFFALTADDYENCSYRIRRSLLPELLPRLPRAAMVDFLENKLDDFLSVLANDSAKKMKVRLSDVVLALAATGEASEEMRLECMVNSNQLEIADEELGDVLSLCRSSVEGERLLGYRILPGVVGRMNAKDVSRAILRSDEANKKLNRFVHEMGLLGDQLGSGIFLLLSYVKELYFDHSSVLAADFMESLLAQKSISCAVLCPPEHLFSFLSVIHKMSANPAFLLQLLSDPSKKGTMYAKDIGSAFASIRTEFKSDAVEALRGALRGERVFPAGTNYDLTRLVGLHDALTLLGKKYNSENYAFSHDKTSERMRRLYESSLATQGINFSYGSKDATMSVKLVRENHELIELGDICSFCIGGGAYAESAFEGKEAHFAIIGEDGAFKGAATFKVPSFELDQMKYAKNADVPGHIKAAIVRAVTDYVVDHWQQVDPGLLEKDVAV